MDKTKEELMPCPFCGGKARFDKVDESDSENVGGEFIQCTKCQTGTKLIFPLNIDVKPLLCEIWNNRVSSPSLPPQEETAKLKELVSEIHAKCYGRATDYEILDDLKRILTELRLSLRI